MEYGIRESRGGNNVLNSEFMRLWEKWISGWLPEIYCGLRVESQRCGIVERLRYAKGISVARHI